MTTKPSGTRRHQRQQQRLKLRATPDAATSPPKLISLSPPQPLLSIRPPQYFFLLRDISLPLTTRLPILSGQQTICREGGVIGINFGVREKNPRCFKSEI